MGVIRILFLADSHLGFDFPFNPRIKRRRRGDDFFANFHLALQTAWERGVHVVIHGGDLLFRSKVPARLVDMAMEPLKDIADRGLKVFIVPGNHERSRIPFGLLSMHPNIHVFDHPRTFLFQSEEGRLSLSGFPYWRDDVRRNFSQLLQESGWEKGHQSSDASILCLHHCIEGATVGPGNYTFRYKKDVIRTADIPPEMTAVLSGHIHRFQVLTHDLLGFPLSVPVLYPGSLERTSFAEKDEKKGFLLLEVETGGAYNKPALRWEFLELPARPMENVRISASGRSAQQIRCFIRKAVTELDPNSVVKLHIEGDIADRARSVLSAESLRSLAPPQMNIIIRGTSSVLSQR